MASKQLIETRRHVAQEVNRPKSELMHLLRQLESAGDTAKAKSLDAIIGKLEAWQGRCLG